MNLKRELRQRRKKALKKEKEIEMQKVRNESEQRLVEEFIRERLTRNADLGYNWENFSSEGEHVKDEHGEWIYLNINDFENFAKKHHLKIQYLDKDLRKEVDKRYADRVVFYF